MSYKNHFIFPFILFTCFCLNAQEHKFNQEIIDSLTQLSLDDELPKLERLKYSKKLSKIAKETENDSLILRANRILSMVYYQLDMDSDYISINKSNLELAKKLNDSFAVVVATTNLGSIYRYQLKNDSSYFYYKKSLKYFSPTENTYLESNSYLYIADIFEEENDFTNSEVNAIKAIKILESLKETEIVLDDLWIANNLLAIINKELKNYEKSLEYYDIAIEIANRKESGYLNEVYSLHNKAIVYRLLGDYDEAIMIFENLISDKEKYNLEDPKFYPSLLDNLAYTKFISGDYDYAKVEGIFKEGYTLSESIDDSYTKMSLASNIAKFYLAQGDKTAALNYAQEAYDLGKELSTTEIILESLVTLSKIKEGDEGIKYLNEHIRLSDSLLYLERANKNKFARIEYETDQLEAENEQISKENFYLLILSAGLLLTAVLVYLVISQRAKNRKLKLIQVQQKANEDIYNLMLSQQDKVDEARTLEKKRISEELHDGVLGRLFGTRLSLDSINFKDGKEAMMTRANYIGQLKTIEEDIRKISHELNTDFVSGSGFMDIVSELIENQTKAYGLTYDFNYTDDISWDSVSNKTKINIYRIIQESMQNIYKHANAKAIKISISLENDVICLDIIDDGEGFDTSKSKKGIGLKNMTSRVEDINGKITFTSQSGNGTTVNVKIPYNNQST
ncbi:tetratricopeptide repeat-containing sensor histidine kinase [Winogradskyella algicola]|uniref:tetratricopeptide repeat-containing sensor histidine kinase n=1 Tax=Winogradskyella algicola TaxID=2575815 RepID=UPI00110863E8|nr:tetratricopeptide repeat-containing sensor histidine kinase [Winogradskyella algicola]